jgi:hypothetical protein
VPSLDAFPDTLENLGGDLDVEIAWPRHPLPQRARAIRPADGAALANHQPYPSMIKHKAVSPLYLRSEPPRLKPRSRPDPTRLGLAIGRRGIAIRSTGAFLFGFMAASTPIFIYIAWIAWRIG